MSIMSSLVETVTIPVSDFAYLKDIETRFNILKKQMLHAEYCPIHTQVILGIENEKKEQKELSILASLNEDDGK